MDTGSSSVFMMTVVDPEYWDYHGWEHTDAIGALFGTLEGAKKYREEFYAEQYSEYPHTSQMTVEQWAEITELFVNN